MSGHAAVAAQRDGGGERDELLRLRVELARRGRGGRHCSIALVDIRDQRAQIAAERDDVVEDCLAMNVVGHAASLVV